MVELFLVSTIVLQLVGIITKNYNNKIKLGEKKPNVQLLTFYGCTIVIMGMMNKLGCRHPRTVIVTCRTINDGRNQDVTKDRQSNIQYVNYIKY